MTILIRSPFCIGPTPCGVPVRIRSCGKSVMTEETKETICSTEKIMSEVFESWTSRSFRKVRIRSRFGSGVSRAATVLPTGQNVSKDLAPPQVVGFV